MSAAKAGRGTGPAKQINLALQGGGAHGAYTWGVLDRLLEEPRIEIDAISGTSAGAMNAVVLAAGLSDDGAQGARSHLDQLWRRVADLDRLSPIQRNLWDWMGGGFRLDNSPGLAFVETLTRTFSPYQVNPLNLNPLRGLIEDMVDFDLVRYASRVKLFISATNVSTGRARIFENREITTEVLLASTCLPHVFQAVEIEGEHYWDGGYMGNPAIFPLIYGSDTRDVVIVQINPLERKGVPKTARDIQDRVNEISFNASLIHEMRAIHFVTRLIHSGALDEALYKRMLIHMIESEDTLEAFGASSKMNADWGFLCTLKEIGRNAADSWLDANFDKLGEESSIDVAATFL
ncbi:MAG: patatin-like phospholipase family protein [Proteobacteria bacterium]|nr:patatin-like phospholipase family protein [Pseudomonadota bacterium]